MSRRYSSTVLLFGVLVCARGALGEEKAATRPAGSTPRPRVPAGSLFMCGGGSLPALVFDQFVELAGGGEGRLVVIPTAGSDQEAEREAEIIRPWADRGLGSVSVLHTRDRAKADTDAFVSALHNATAVWFCGGQQSRLAESYAGTATELAIVELFHRGGVVGGTSAGAAIQSRVMIESGNSTPKISTGLDLLPGSIIDQHFGERDRIHRLQLAVREHPACIGVGIDESTAVVFQRGECRVLGDSCVTVVSASTDEESLAVRTFRSGELFRLQEE